jgi:hypothetical protein
MKVTLSYFAGAGWQFFTNTGSPLTGGLIYTYEAGTTTPLTTYTSSSGVTANANPIVLDSAGRVSSQIWLELSTPYKFVLKTSAGVTIGTYDNLIGVGGITSAQGVVSVKDFGAGAGDANDAPFIQDAIDYVDNLGGGVVYFPVGEYLMQSEVNYPSNITFRGEGQHSLLKVNSATGFYIFNQASVDVENVVWDSLGFDGSLNYVTDPTIYKQDYTLRNTAIRSGGIAVSKVVVQNCYFEKMSNGSIDFNGNYSEGISIINNTFIDGCYCYKVVAVRTPTGAPLSDAARPSNILYQGNYILGGGPTVFYDASKEAWTASTDGLDVDSCKEVIIANNIVDGVASIGIRCEQSVNVKIVNNTVRETGSTGIMVYYDNQNVVVANNSVTNWGRIAPVYCMRLYSGSYYAAEEFPDSSLAPLPANPSAAAWFYVWPYATTGVNLSTVLAYSDTNYYGVTTDGILPFRGESAIAVTQGSVNVSITGNTILGNITTTGGQYNYACDFGISCIHPVNSPGGAYLSMNNSMISGNTIVDCITQRIYHPEFTDPTFYNTASYRLGNAFYGVNRDSSSSIWSGNTRLSFEGQLIAVVDAGATGRSNFQANWMNFPSTQSASSNVNTLDDYEEGVFDVTLTCVSGTATLDFTRMAYTKIGRQVTITGQIQVSAVSTPSGAVTMGNLPFPIVAISQRAQFTSTFVRSTNLVGTPSGVVVASSGSGASVSTLTLALFNDNVYADLGTSLQANSQFTFNFSYFAAT